MDKFVIISKENNVFIIIVKRSDKLYTSKEIKCQECIYNIINENINSSNIIDDKLVIETEGVTIRVDLYSINENEINEKINELTKELNDVKHLLHEINSLQ